MEEENVELPEIEVLETVSSELTQGFGFRVVSFEPHAGTDCVGNHQVDDEGNVHPNGGVAGVDMLGPEEDDESEDKEDDADYQTGGSEKLDEFGEGGWRLLVIEANSEG